ncbi:hypothetical protein PG994_013025 [Apiospora phragmitis]|uniref:Uncharacterized protein n=1 Tax=Apiospora phragmitis TaxID=2905665 RepID=A0ABR1T7H0_9PEZI
MASWISRLTPTGRGEEQLKQLGEVTQEKPQLEQGSLSEKLELAEKQAHIMSADNNESSSEKETQREHLARHFNQLTKSESPEPATKNESKSKGKAVACDWKGDPVEPQYDDLAAQHNTPDHAELSSREIPETRGPFHPRTYWRKPQRLGQQHLPAQTTPSAVARPYTRSPTEADAKPYADAGRVFAPRPTPTSDKEESNRKTTKIYAKDPTKDSLNESVKDSTKDSANKPIRKFPLEQFEKPSKDNSNVNGKKTDKETTKSNGRLPGESPLKPESARLGLHTQPHAEDANSNESAQGKGPEPQPDDTNHLFACKYFHRHPAESSQDVESGGDVCVVDPEPFTDEPESTREKQKQDPEHAGRDEVIGVIHPANCEEHPEAKEEHLVCDNPRLGKMIAVYQKIEAKQQEVMDKMTKKTEEKEQKARVKREAKEKKAREKQERREKRALEKQERKAEKAMKRQERQERRERQKSRGSTTSMGSTTETYIPPAIPVPPAASAT